MNVPGAPTTVTTSGRILCVDDERQVLDGLASYLRIHHEVVTATNAADALAYMEEEPLLDVVISDMRMPNIDGVQFFVRARALAPDVCRILLTGYADVDSIVSVINEGQIFRLLTKPCPPQTVLAAVEAAVRQSRRVRSERDIQEATLLACVEALSGELAVNRPELFGRARRLQRLVIRLVQALKWSGCWQFAAAALLSELSVDATQDPTSGDAPGFPATGVPSPFLDDMRAMIAGSARPCGSGAGGADRSASQRIARGAQLLRTVRVHELLSERGWKDEDILAKLKAESGAYDPLIVAALVDVLADRGDAIRFLALRIPALSAGMVLAKDLMTSDGVLIMRSGGEITFELIERIRGFRENSIQEPVHVVDPGGIPAA